MNPNRKKILAVMGIVLIFGAGTWLFLNNRNSDRYIFDKKDGIGMEEVHTLRNSVDFDGMNPSEVGINAIKNLSSQVGEKTKDANKIDLSYGRGPMVLKYFRFLQTKFKMSSNVATHCSDIWKYLLSVMPKNEAEKIFAAYRKYLDCEIELSKKVQELGQPKNLDEVLEMLAKVQDFRREMLGDEMADGLYGAEVKTREYALRRGSIVSDKKLYGEEKENQIASLTSDMWSESPEKVQSIQPPYNRYREKLEIFSRDLSELGSEEEREERVAEFRKEFFSPDTVARLDDVDKQIKSEKIIESQYRQKESEVMSSVSMNEKEKKEVIETLQARYFGDDAESFRRREAMRKGREDMNTKYAR